MDRWLASISRLIAFAVIMGAAHASASAEEELWAKRRAAMVRVIQEYAASLPAAGDSDGIAEAVLDVMLEAPRHLFVPQPIAPLAYEDSPLPIGYGQTISQPFIVALMTHLLDVGPEATVLEIGTGSGYQAAVLSPLVKTVCTIEIIPELGNTAAQRLEELGYDNVQATIGDGYFGWRECGPFDAIIVTAAAGHIPPPLVEQLKPGGRMVIPVGSVFGPEYLTLVSKTADNRVKTRQVLPVRFVPFTRGSQ